ncbi:MAG: hypothetical protein HYR72_06625 [Deltaproteobacteria bacterium]|nr:hypothetical protein [Deltaproteobacteria bacterium]MBI3387121.1 hypothetical protein [Deltaproteobacteria bacterium]
MREFIYGLILGAASIWCYRYFDAAGILSYLNSSTQWAVESTRGYGGKVSTKK